jgi:YfiH family protein
MSFQSQNGIKYFQFDSFPSSEVGHGFFTRLGGISPAPWDSLNVGGTVGDDIDRVVENRKRLFHVLNKDITSVFDVWQVHSGDVVCTDRPRYADEDYIQADGILTSSRDVTLFMRFADCVPIMLYDPTQKVIGIVHAGWQGTVKKVTAAAIEKMRSVYGANPKDILAGIGPSICADCYEVKGDVIEEVYAKLGEIAPKVIIEKPGGETHFDMWLANTLILQNSGVEKIEVSGVCTACNHTEWFSHRADHGKTGRFGAAIRLQ